MSGDLNHVAYFPELDPEYENDEPLNFCTRNELEEDDSTFNQCVQLNEEDSIPENLSKLQTAEGRMNVTVSDCEETALNRNPNSSVCDFEEYPSYSGESLYPKREIAEDRREQRERLSVHRDRNLSFTSKLGTIGTSLELQPYPKHRLSNAESHNFENPHAIKFQGPLFPYTSNLIHNPPMSQESKYAFDEEDRKSSPASAAGTPPSMKCLEESKSMLQSSSLSCRILTGPVPPY